ncbi:MAG: c-type cytochrome [Paracoccaceae bacterium]
MIVRALIAVVAAGVVSGLPADSAGAGDASAGRQKARKCQTCHGIDGIARLPTAPHIAGENSMYLTAQLEAFRSGKRQHEIMSLIARDLSDEDIADLAAWYSSIRITAQLPE